MNDLLVAAGPVAHFGLTVREGELTEQFSRSSGPGGQGVGAADSRVQLSLDLATTTALDDEQRARVLERLSTRLSGTVLAISAQEHRSQRSNRAAARQRLADLPHERVATSPPSE
ncbi:MAG: aminoacyl-tRNA hydrolase [Rhodococcus sp. (in: high G+C Gram-positive bacteria)]|nr:aminoacyl-tRNA hydrolase [Rhodococcus sp. (in: high G+C Gram-positive bacteria)]